MPYNIKMFDTLGAITLITPPSMMNPGAISFLLIDLKEEQKNQFAFRFGKIFPNDNISVYIYDSGWGKGNWIDQAVRKSRFIVIDKTNIPIFIDELLPTDNVYEYTAEQTVESIFENIKKTHFPE